MSSIDDSPSDLPVADEPDHALDVAREQGWLAVSALAGDSDEWQEVLTRWEENCHRAGRAAIVLIAERSGLVSVTYLAPPTLAYAGPKLQAEAEALAATHHGPAGYSAGPFGTWSSRRLAAEDAMRLAERLWRIDRFARNERGAQAFEQGNDVAMNWDVVDEVMET